MLIYVLLHASFIISRERESERERERADSCAAYGCDVQMKLTIVVMILCCDDDAFSHCLMSQRKKLTNRDSLFSNLLSSLKRIDAKLS